MTTFRELAQAYLGQKGDDYYPQLEAFVNALVDALENLLATVTTNLTATSTTSLTLGTGSRSLTVQTGKAYAPGNPVNVALTSDPTQRFEGVVVSYDTLTGALVVNATQSFGTGTFNAWTVSLGGATGPQGAQGVQGLSGSQVRPFGVSLDEVEFAHQAGVLALMN